MITPQLMGSAVRADPGRFAMTLSSILSVAIRPWARAVSATVLIACLGIPAIASGQTHGLTEATIADINAAFDAGTLSSEMLVERYLARIDA